MQRGLAKFMSQRRPLPSVIPSISNDGQLVEAWVPGCRSSSLGTLAGTRCFRKISSNFELRRVTLSTCKNLITHPKKPTCKTHFGAVLGIVFGCFSITAPDAHDMQSWYSDCRLRRTSKGDSLVGDLIVADPGPDHSYVLGMTEDQRFS